MQMSSFVCFVSRRVRGRHRGLSTTLCSVFAALLVLASVADLSDPAAETVVADPSLTPQSSYVNTQQQQQQQQQQSSNKEFWDNLYQNSIMNTKKRYDVVNSANVCLQCPISREAFTTLHTDAKLRSAGGNLTHNRYGQMMSAPAPPRVTIMWASESSTHMTYYCKNGRNLHNQRSSSNSNANNNNNNNNQVAEAARQQSASASQSDQQDVEFVCEDTRLCLLNVRSHYPSQYKCMVKSNVFDVKMNVIGKEGSSS